MTPSISKPAGASQNARTHGLTAKHLLVTAEELPLFDSLQNSLKHELAPVGELENSLADRIIRAHWDLYKLDGLQAGLLSKLDPFNDKHTAALNRLSLYRSRTENGLTRASHELRALQEERYLRAAALKDVSKTFPPLIRIAHIQQQFHRFPRLKNQTRPSPSSAAALRR